MLKVNISERNSSRLIALAKSLSNVIIIAQLRCSTLQKLSYGNHHEVAYNLNPLVLIGIWFSVKLKHSQIIARLTKWWRFNVNNAGQVLSVIGLITSFSQSIALTRQRCTIMIKKTIGLQRNGYHVSHFCIAFRGCDFWLLIPSAFFAYPEYRFEG